MANSNHTIGEPIMERVNLVEAQAKLNQFNQNTHYDYAKENCLTDDIRRVGQRIFEED